MDCIHIYIYILKANSIHHWSWAYMLILFNPEFAGWFTKSLSLFFSPFSRTYWSIYIHFLLPSGFLHRWWCTQMPSCKFPQEVYCTPLAISLGSTDDVPLWNLFLWVEGTYVLNLRKMKGKKKSLKKGGDSWVLFDIKSGNKI